MNIRLKKISCSIFFLLIFAGCIPEHIRSAEEQPGAKTTKLKVVTYNIFGARQGGLSASDITAIANVIKRINPHLVALQEVDVNTKRNGVNRNIAKEIAEQCGMDFFFAKAMDFDGGEYGDAVLSKLPIKATKAYGMTVLPAYGGEPRSVAQVKVEVDNQELYFMSTHFDHKYEQNRKHQSMQLVTILESLELPFILGGDLNAGPDAESIRILSDKFNIGCGERCKQEKTFSSSNPVATIDYILSSKTTGLSVDYYGVQGWATTQSDHFPVYAIYNMTSAP